jgi:hypothetical protein
MMINFALTSQHNTAYFPQGTTAAKGGKDHGHQMIIGLKTLLITVNHLFFRCPGNNRDRNKF